MCEATFVSVSRDASRVAKRDTLLVAVMNNETGVSMWAPHQAIRRTMHFERPFFWGVSGFTDSHGSPFIFQSMTHGFSRVFGSRILTGVILLGKIAEMGQATKSSRICTGQFLAHGSSRIDLTDRHGFCPVWGLGGCFWLSVHVVYYYAFAWDTESALHAKYILL